MNVNGKNVFKLAAAACLITLGISGNTFGQSSNGQGGVIPPPPRTNGVGGQQNGNFAPQSPAIGQQPQQFVPPGRGQPQQQSPDFTSPPRVQQPQAPSYVDDGLPELVKLFSATPIDQVFMNGKPADGRRVSNTVVEIFIVGDENGYPCTNIFDIIFGNGQVGKLTANHCHGETEFAVIPGETLSHEETHDGNIDERSSGIDTLSSDFQWSYFADATRTGLQVSVPETDNVMFFAECQRGTSNAIVYMFVAPQGIQLNQRLSLAVVVDGGATANYDMGVTNFPYLEAGPVPAMQIGTNHPFFEDLAGGQIADFYVSSDNDQAGLRILLKGSAKPVRSFAAACTNK